jgi:hypothetical protein
MKRRLLTALEPERRSGWPGLLCDATADPGQMSENSTSLVITRLNQLTSIQGCRRDYYRTDREIMIISSVTAAPSEFPYTPMFETRGFLASKQAHRDARTGT